MMLLRRLWHLLNRPRRERELVREMNEHRASMHDPSKFGDTHRLLERSRDEWGWNWLDDAMQDLTVGVRALIKAPSFTITAALILTFGIGLNLALYQIIQVALLRPVPIKNVQSWARFYHREPHSSTSTIPYPLIEFAKANNNVLAAVIVEDQTPIAWGQDAAEQIDGAFVSANWFDELGYGPLHGRMLSETIDTRSDIPSIVVSYAFWKRRLGAEPRVVGTTAYIDRKPVVIAGVAQEHFPGLDFAVPDVFIPISQREYFYPESTLLRSWTGGVDMYGRFRDGVNVSAAREGLRATMQAAAQIHPEFGPDHWFEPLLATRGFMRDSERTAVLIVMSLIAALTGLVLVVAAANLGNLVMSRATGRVRELGVRMALGARRSRIIRQLVIESIPLVALGVAGSVAFAAIAASVVGAVAQLPPFLDFSVNWLTIVLAIALGAMALIVAGLIPAWKVAQQHLIDAIRDGGQQVSQSLDRALMRRVMVAAQVAGSCVLLIIAGMMVRSVQRVVSANVGFDYERAAVLEMPLGRYGMTAGTARSYWYEVKERVRANPEVQTAAIVTAPPLGGRVYETGYNDTPGLRTMSQSVDPEYFEVMQIALLSGRVFGPGEPGVVLISRRLALEMYGTLDVLGQPFPKSAGGRSRSSSDVAKLSAPEGTVIGVTADAHSIKVNATDVAELYRPLTNEDFSLVFLVARARTDADRLPPILREAASIDPRVIPAAHAMHEDFDSAMRGPRVAGMITSTIGLLTLVLACLGIFGVVSYSVALRTKEIGIRVALGAEPTALVRVLVRNILAPVASGIALGVVLAAAAGALLKTEPFYLENVDPIAFTGALIVLLVAGGIAALWPALRMLRGNPVEALRHS